MKCLTVGEGTFACSRVDLRPDNPLSNEPGEAEADDHDQPRNEVVPRIGRFVVLNRIGEGSMGEVYSAYDAELDRKLAIKLLRREGRASARGTARLLREALALAKLSHPNVVQIYDVGQVDDGVFIAMEFIQGRDLSGWLAERRRSWREIVDVFEQAGEGLAAAHRAGLVHRDFKPENVMVGADGRVRVLDFGVAIGGETSEDVGDLRASNLDIRASQAHTLTETEALVGTPAYMAPEQLYRRPATAASDQFSFCVALHEALYGQRPFAASTVGELLARIEKGPRPPAGEGQRAPGRLYRTIARGLARNPLERFPGMPALLTQLRRDTRKLRWLWIPLTAAALVAIGGVAWMVRNDDGVGACTRGEEQLAGIWDDERRQALHAAFLASPITYARDTTQRIEPVIDTYAASWVAAYTQSCLAHREGEISAELLDRRMGCLRVRRGELRALVDVLTEGSASAVENAGRAAGALVSVDRCSDDAAARSQRSPPPPELEPAVQELALELARIKAEHDAGLYDTGLALSSAAVEQARALGYEPALAEALSHHGMLLLYNGRFPEAETALYDALTLADANADDPLRAELLSTLVVVVGDRQGRRAEALRLAQIARGALRRMGGDPTIEKWLLVTEGSVLRAQGELSTARERLARALELASREPNPTARIAPLSELGNVELFLGEFAAARGHMEEAVEIARRELGPRHPQLVYLNNNLASAYRQEKRTDAAEEALQEALTIARASLGGQHPIVASVLDSLGLVHTDRGDYRSAIPLYEQARAIIEHTLGPRHASLMPVAVDLLEAHIAVGALADAEASADRVIAIWEASGRDIEHDLFLAELLLRLVAILPDDERERARGFLDVSQTIARTRNAAPILITGLAALARIDHAAGEHAQALRRLQQATEAAATTSPTTDPVELGRARFALAGALWAVGERERGRTLAETVARELPPAGAEQLQAELGAWLTATAAGREPPR